jgi:hypothetical protein
MQGRVQDDVSKMKRLQPKHRKKKKKKKSPDRKKSLGHELGMSMQYPGSYIFTQQVGRLLLFWLEGKKRRKRKKV